MLVLGTENTGPCSLLFQYYMSLLYALHLFSLLFFFLWSGLYYSITLTLSNSFSPLLSCLIVPNSIHAESRLRDTHPRHARQELVLPPVNLQPSLLVVGYGHPLVGPVARRNGVAVSAAGGRGIQANLALDGAGVGQLEGGNVARQVEAVCAGGGEEVPARVGEGADVGAVLGPAVGDAGGDERVVAVGEDGHVGGGIDEVLADAVALFHEGVEVGSRGVDGDPARVVARVGAVDGADELELGRRGVELLVDPELVGLEVGGVEVRLGRVEDHAVDAAVGLVLVVLDVGGEGARGWVGGEDGAVAGVLVKGVAVDCVGGLAGGEEEDGAGVCFGGCGEGCCLILC